MAMKGFLVKSMLVCAVLLFSLQANAQISLGNIIKNVMSGSNEKSDSANESSTDDDKQTGTGLLSALTSIFSNDKIATKDKIIGTWVYEEPAVVLTGDNAIKNIGGKLAAHNAADTVAPTHAAGR